MRLKKYFDVVIIGAGAAGLMCAIEAGKRKRSVLVLEHNGDVGKKIRISGGGRCNFTNTHTTPGNFISQNPHFARSALARYTPQDFCTLANAHNIAFHEKKLGQLFCDKSAQDIIELLKKECAQYKATILLQTNITKVVKENLFALLTTRWPFECQSLVIATGGLSIPTLGATDFGYAIAKQFTITVNPCRPALVPLTFNPKDLRIFKELAGISLNAMVYFEDASFRENILFTHKGLSGPAILQISSYWKPGKPIRIDLLPHADMSMLLKTHQTDKTTLKNLLKEHFPSRLADVLCANFFKNKPLNQYSEKQLEQIAHFLHHWTINPQGTEGYAKAEVTAGGINTNELSSKTMESKKVPGLYFIGEVVDVTGHLGGFNFQWAWASGFAAGQYV